MCFFTMQSATTSLASVPHVGQNRRHKLDKELYCCIAIVKAASPPGATQQQRLLVQGGYQDSDAAGAGREGGG